MTQKQRIAIQRALVREAIGKLRAAEEFFGSEDTPASAGANPVTYALFQDFEAKVNDFERWVFEDSALA